MNGNGERDAMTNETRHCRAPDVRNLPKKTLLTSAGITQVDTDVGTMIAACAGYARTAHQRKLLRKVKTALRKYANANAVYIRAQWRVQRLSHNAARHLADFLHEVKLLHHDQPKGK